MIFKILKYVFSHDCFFSFFCLGNFLKIESKKYLALSFNQQFLSLELDSIWTISFLFRNTNVFRQNPSVGSQLFTFLMSQPRSSKEKCFNVNAPICKIFYL